MRKCESGTNNLLHQQISAHLQQLLVWHSGDYDELQSQRSRVQIQVSVKKNWGLDLRLGLGLGGSMGLGLRMGLDVWLGGVKKKFDHHLEDTAMTKLTYTPPGIL